MAKKFDDLWRRVAVACGVLMIVALLLGFSYFPLIQLCIAIVLAALTAIGVWEYGKISEKKGINVPITLLVIFSLLFTAGVYGSVLFPYLRPMPWAILIGIGMVLFVYFFRHSEGALINISTSFFGICYVAVPIALMINILYPFSLSATGQDGRIWLTYLIGVTKITDVGAYFGGKLLGKHRLSPVLSPKKTIEGAVCGFVAAVALSFCFSAIFSFTNFNLTLVQSLWLGGTVGIIGQFGDLAESLLKRDARIKDSNTLPGLGGVLDMVDSLLFTIPVVAFYLYLF